MAQPTPTPHLLVTRRDRTSPRGAYLSGEVRMTVAAIVAVVGLLLYGLLDHAKAMEVGRIMFAIGLLVALWAIREHFIALP